MKYAAYFKSGLGNFINAIPAFIALSEMDERGQIDLILDGDWTQDPRVPAVKCIAENSFYINKIEFWPDVDLNQYEKFFIPVQCEPSKAAREMLRRNREKGYAKNYVWPNPVWRDILQHEIDTNLNNIKSLGYDNGVLSSHYIPIGERPDDLHPPGCRLRPFYFCLCNGAFAAKMWDKKRWPFFASLAKLLKKYYRGCKIIGVGGPDELNGVELDHDYTGKTNIMQTAAIINDSDYMITTDTGCMHIADALRVKGLALFGPTLISKNGPVYGTIKAIKKDLRCSPCQEDERFFTCNANSCMELLKPDMVMDRIIKDLN